MPNLSPTMAFYKARFTDDMKAYLHDELNLIKRLFLKLSPAELYIQDSSVRHLDLALASPIHIPWKRYIKNLFYRRLPFFCREFFIAETVPEEETFAWFYHRLLLLLKGMHSGFMERLKDFREVIVLKFETKIFHEISDTDFHLKCAAIRKYLRCCPIIRVDRFSVTFPYLMDLCLYSPLYFELTVDLLTTFCNTAIKKLSVVTVVENAGMLEKLLLHAKLARFDFWGMWEGVIPMTTYISHFLSLSFDQECMKILIKYGFPYIATQVEFRQRFFDMRRIGVNRRSIIRSFRVFRSERPREMTRMLLIADIFLIFANEDNHYKIPTLKYLFRSMAIPYVTPQELHSVMSEVVFPNYEDRLKEIVTLYAESNDFDDDITTPTPRLLVHLCRVALRKVLVDNFLPLEAIQDFPIPRMLKAYLRLEY